MSTLPLSHHPYRVLIVDDERRDWANPMKEALEDCARQKGITRKFEIDIAEDKHRAEELLGRYNYHLTSVDIRLPAHKEDLLSVDPGLALASSFPWVGFPKLLIYSQLLRVKEFQDHPNESMKVLQVRTDLYAKPTGGDADREPKAVESLTVKSWAERMAESLVSDELELTASPGYEKHFTIIGAYLNHGVNAIPPFLASHLQALASHWTDQSNDRVDAAIAFIEGTARLAFAQSAVLCQAEGEAAEVPSDDSMAACHHGLEILCKRLSGWNWCNYLTPETLQAFRQARHERNDKVHSSEVSDPQKRWAGLRSPLQYALDLAAYWVRHPLAVDLRYSHDGWTAELLAGTANPRPRRSLPQAMQFPTEAVRSGVWQNVWRLGEGGTDKQERKAISWEDWLVPDTQTARQWWFPVYQRGRSKTFINLVSGRKRSG